MALAFPETLGFVPSTKCDESIDYIFQTSQKRLGEMFDLQKNGIYILFTKHERKKTDIDDYAIAFLSDDKKTLHVLNIPFVPYLGGQSDTEWIEFNNKLIMKSEDRFNKLCTKEIDVPEIFTVAEKFISKKYFSLEKERAPWFSESFYIVEKKINEEKQCFHMSSLESVRRFLSERISLVDEYVELYEKFQNILFSGME